MNRIAILTGATGGLGQAFLRELLREDIDEIWAVARNQKKLEEIKIYKALDKMEAILQHNEAPISTWIPLEYDLNKTYGFEQAAFSPYLTALREQMLSDTENKIEESKKAP